MNKAFLAVSAAVALSGCQQRAAEPAAAPLSEAEAAKIADASEAAWTSMDVARIDPLYAGDVVAFDVGEPAMVAGSEAMQKVNTAFAAMKFDKAAVPDRKIQVLDADTFVVSGTATLTSTEGELKEGTIRFSDVYQKQADGGWKIVNEHISFPPEAAASD